MYNHPDPDPNWAKILDPGPDPTSMYLDPQHCFQHFNEMPTKIYVTDFSMSVKHISECSACLDTNIWKHKFQIALYTLEGSEVRYSILITESWSFRFLTNDRMFRDQIHNTPDWKLKFQILYKWLKVQESDTHIWKTKLQILYKYCTVTEDSEQKSDTHIWKLKI